MKTPKTLTELAQREALEMHLTDWPESYTFDQVIDWLRTTEWFRTNDSDFTEISDAFIDRIIETYKSNLALYRRIANGVYINDLED